MTVDLDNDNKLELVILSGADLYIFKSNADNSYYLWYFRRDNAKTSIQFYDFNNDGKKDFIWSKTGTDNQGRLRLYADIFKASGLSDIKDDPYTTIPQSVKLYQNYPNPFNPSTSIKYEISKRDLVTIVVYDILGREIKTLLNEIKNPGIYTINWNASNLSSGIYYYQLKTSSSTQTKKALLLK
ncbi:MAG: T9SS type A sorting domain-containing protein [Bacteroidota bacterium]|nr:T9SS type A sorting domain-containing protein [Bacteroidota bacterium]